MYLYLQYSRPPLFSIFCQMFGRRPTISVRPIFVDIPGPSQWFFHFGEAFVIALTQEKTTTLGGTESYQSS